MSGRHRANETIWERTLGALIYWARQQVAVKVEQKSIEA